MNWMNNAVICLALSAGACGPRYGHPLVNRAVARGHSWTHRTVQEEIDKLPEVGRKALVAPMTLALNDCDSYVRQNAAEGLGNLDQLALPSVPALEQALGDEDEQVRRVAALALARLGQPSGAFIIPQLLEQLKGDASFVRYLHVITYWDLKYDRRRDLNWLGRHQAANGLFYVAAGSTHLPLPGAVAALTQALADPFPSVRFVAASALSAFGPDAAAAVPALNTLLTDPDANTRSIAAATLRILADPTRAR